MQEPILEDEKKCTKCGEVKKKSEFYSGVARCKRCRIKESSLLRKTTSKWKETQKAYYKSPAGKASRARGERRHREMHPDKAKARAAMKGAVRRGKIIRPSECSRCESSCKPEAHHHSYKWEDRFNVEWLCRPCHLAEHERLKIEGLQ